MSLLDQASERAALAADYGLDTAIGVTQAIARPPHFPDPNADPIAILEATIAAKDEIIGAQYAEMTAWRSQLETALTRVKELESAMAQRAIDHQHQMAQ